MNELSASITWIVRVHTPALRTEQVMKLLGKPGLQLPHKKRIAHIYENLEDADSVAELCRSLMPMLKKVARLQATITCEVHVNLRFCCAREDYFVALPPPLIKAISEVNALVELYFVGGPPSADHGAKKEDFAVLGE